MAKLIYAAIASLDGYVEGGAELAGHAIGAGLVDECHLFLCPIVSRSADRLRSPGEGPCQARPTTPGDPKNMTLKRMDNVLIVVEDLEAAKAFFVELGMELEGQTLVEGPSV